MDIQSKKRWIFRYKTKRTFSTDGERNCCTRCCEAKVGRRNKTVGGTRQMTAEQLEKVIAEQVNDKQKLIDVTGQLEGLHIENAKKNEKNIELETAFKCEKEMVTKLEKELSQWKA